MFIWYFVIFVLGLASFTLFWLASNHRENAIRAALQQPRRVSIGYDYTATMMRRVAIALAAVAVLLLVLKVLRVL